MEEPKYDKELIKLQLEERKYLLNLFYTQMER